MCPQVLPLTPQCIPRAPRYSCFELFGFDVLLDERLRPWLLEVNISPSLHSACSLDYMVKGPLISHLLTMASFHVPDHRSLQPYKQVCVCIYIIEGYGWAGG